MLLFFSFIKKNKFHIYIYINDQLPKTYFRCFPLLSLPEEAHTAPQKLILKDQSNKNPCRVCSTGQFLQILRTWHAEHAGVNGREGDFREVRGPRHSELIRKEHPGKVRLPNPARFLWKVTLIISFRNHNN